jgi:hypothetical protein
MGKTEIIARIRQLEIELEYAQESGSIINVMAIERAIRELEEFIK